MDVDEDDDFYAPEEPTVPSAPPAQAPQAAADTRADQHEDLEEGEEEDEGGAMDEDDDDDSDIDIITERKDGTKAAPPSQSRYSEIRNIPQRTTSNDATVKPAAVKREDSAKPSGGASGADLPAVSTSKIDINAIPVHKGTGKPITQVNIDEDLPENDKPWRKPGTDISDYFNYGFDEFTWALYAAKQEAIRGEYNSDIVAQNNKKMMEDMTNMMMMGGMPGMSMPGMPGGASGSTGAGNAAAGGMPAMPGMEGMPPEMQAMMQQMMASGMDPSQMDASSMSAMFSGMQNAGGAGAAGQGGQGQSFGGAGFGNNQGQGYGYDQQGMGAGNRGGFGGARGRGGRRNW